MIDRRDFMGAIAGAAIAGTKSPESPTLKKGSVLSVSYTGHITPFQRKIIDSFTYPLTFEEWDAKYGGKTW